MNVSKEPVLKDFLGWRIAAWQSAINFWDGYLLKHNNTNKKGLEIGANEGRLTLYMHKKYGVDMVCSDIEKPHIKAAALHKKFNIADKITYKVVDVTDIPYPDNYFDYVIVKSVLISIPPHTKERQQQAVNEILRVLKSGGVVFFAENLKGGLIYKWLRKLFIPWGEYTRYLTVPDVKDLFGQFSELQYNTSGFLAPFAKSRLLERLLSMVDLLVDKILPEKYRYIIYGYAKK